MPVIDMKRLMNFKRDFRLEKKSDKEYKLYIYGSIGGWFNDNNAREIQRKLREIKAEKIHVHINSGGGSAFDGVAICNLLKQHDAEIVVHIDGYAASAASVIAMAGDEIVMPSNTMLMIHQASTFEWGNADAFEKVAKDLRKIDTAIRQTYKNRFVGTEDELIQLLKDETWLTADESKALGFADKIVDEIEIDESKEVEEETENFKEDIIAKYAAQHKPKEPTSKLERKKPDLSKLFLHL